MILTWFTSPKTKSEYGYSTFYYFDTITSNFVRIRLELERPGQRGDDGAATAWFYQTRFVGFESTNKQAEFNDITGDQVTAAHLTNFEMVDADNCPQVGDRVYDTSFDTVGDELFIYTGGTVTDKPFLPRGIDKHVLMLMADYLLVHRENIRFADSSVPASTLVDRFNATLSAIRDKFEYKKINSSKKQLVRKPANNRNLSYEAAMNPLKACQGYPLFNRLAQSVLIHKAYKNG